MNNEWQPIETAPKDGSRVLAYCQPKYVESGKPMGWGYINAVWYREGFKNNSLWQWRHVLNDSAAEPTHWMPLPLPPATRPQVRG